MGLRGGAHFTAIRGLLYQIFGLTLQDFGAHFTGIRGLLYGISGLTLQQFGAYLIGFWGWLCRNSGLTLQEFGAYCMGYWGLLYSNSGLTWWAFMGFWGWLCRNSGPTLKASEIKALSHLYSGLNEDWWKESERKFWSRGDDTNARRTSCRSTFLGIPEKSVSETVTKVCWKSPHKRKYYIC